MPGAFRRRRSGAATPPPRRCCTTAPAAPSIAAIIRARGGAARATGIPLSPSAFHAQQAQLDIIYAYQQMGEPASAVAAAERFIRLNPRHPRVDYTWYMQGVAQQEQGRGFLDRVLGLERAARDPEPLRQAFEAFRTHRSNATHRRSTHATPGAAWRTSATSSPTTSCASPAFTPTAVPGWRPRTAPPISSGNTRARQRWARRYSCSSAATPSSARACGSAPRGTTRAGV
ncbi:MAG: tetratricopeptide repeat protein [Arhodomonas sp.]|nr:tetratricopeptide repeat protein [Arhodomonas sp.]